MPRSFSALLFCLTAVCAADTEDHVKKSLAAGSATRLKLDAEIGAISVQPGAGSTVDVDVYFRGEPPSRADFDAMLRDFKLDVSQQGSDIRVTGVFENGWQVMPISGFGRRFCRNVQCLKYDWLREVEYRVAVPAQFSAGVTTSGGRITVGDLQGEASARTSGGSISLGKIRGAVQAQTSGGSISLDGSQGSAMLRTSGGSIRIAEVTGDVDAQTSGGSITIDRASGRVTAHTSGGAITVREATGAVNASTSGGSVTASLLAQPKQECRISTSGGSIHVTLAKDVKMNLEASTSGGKVSTDFSLSGDRRQRQLQGPLNGGGPLLYLHTSGGGINVRRAS